MTDWLLNGKGAGQPVLILAHGAGAGHDTPFMREISREIAARGVDVARFEFSYMRRRRLEGKGGGPGRAERLMAEFVWSVREWVERAPVFIGGKSMGGRIASLIADELHARRLAAGLVCLGYPFHPPGKPQNLRTAHLKTLSTPALICQGTRDPFGGPEEAAGYGLSPAVSLRPVPDGDHDFRPRKKSGRTWEENISAAAEAVADFIHAHA